MPNAIPSRIPANPKAFDNVCNTTTLGYLSIRQQALCVPLKSIYASSTTTIPVVNVSHIVSTTLLGITLHVGLPG